MSVNFTQPTNQQPQPAQNANVNQSHVYQTKSLAETKKPAAAAEEVKVDKNVLENAVKNLNQLMGMFNKSFHFGIDEKAERSFVKIINTETDKVVRQIPSEEILATIARMKEVIGIIFDDKF